MGGEAHRTLQSEHVKKLQAILTKGLAVLPADAPSLLRYNATRLKAQLRAAAARDQGSVETRAHLAESLTTLSEALRAKMNPLQYPDIDGRAQFKDGKEYSRCWFGRTDVSRLNALVEGLSARLGLAVEYWSNRANAA